MIETESLWPTTRAPQLPISDSELEYLFMVDKEEIMWKQSLPKYSFSELMKIFPEAVKPAKSGLKANLKFYKQQVRDLNTNQEEYYEDRICNLPWQERTDFKEESDKDFDTAREKINSKIKTTMFNLSYLNELEGKTTPQTMGGVSEADVARAKEISIMGFISGNVVAHRNRAVTICPFHTEKQPSLTVYLDQNSWWCYSCNSGGSVIDFIMKQQNVDFLSAVKFLLI